MNTDTAKSKPLPLMVGIPDDGLVTARLQPGTNALRFVVAGTAGFHNQLPAELRRQMPPVYFGPTGTLAIASADVHQPLVNFTAEPDGCGRSLAILSSAVSDRIACFNHPDAVLRSTRDTVALSLANIRGLHVPVTIRTLLERPSDLIDVTRSAQLSWPVIVRVAGAHSGLATVRIDSAEDVRNALRTIPWGGRALYVTEYVPYVDDDRMHRKMRIVVVGRDVFLRHAITTRHWHAHARDHDPAYDGAESELMAKFDSDLKPGIEERIHAIADAMDLDYFGIDCCLRPDGRLLIFEANANMNILYNSRPDAPYCVRELARITRSLVTLLGNPGLWRHPGRAIPPLIGNAPRSAMHP